MTQLDSLLKISQGLNQGLHCFLKALGMELLPSSFRSLAKFCLSAKGQRSPSIPLLAVSCDSVLAPGEAVCILSMISMFHVQQWQIEPLSHLNSLWLFFMLPLFLTPARENYLLFSSCEQFWLTQITQDNLPILRSITLMWLGKKLLLYKLTYSWALFFGGWY